MPSNLLKSILVFTLFAFFIQHESNAQCATNFDVITTPEPIVGGAVPVFIAGQTVEFCGTVSNWDFTDGTGIGQFWFHGVQPIKIGTGWQPLNASSGTQAPTSCSGNVGGIGWVWSDHPTLGWGWYFEAPNVTLPIDTDPSNNLGDSNSLTGGAACTWEFCFEMVTKALVAGTEGESLNLEIATYSDGFSGADATISSCNSDLPWTLNANLTLCSMPELNVALGADPVSGVSPVLDAVSGVYTICPGDNLTLTADLDLTSVPTPTVVDYFWEGPNFWNSSDQNPVLLNASAGTYTVFVEVDGCVSQDYKIEVAVAGTPDLAWSASIPPPICEGVGVLTLAPDIGSVSGGSWSGDGVTDLGDGTATFDPAVVSGMTPVTYSVTVGTCTSEQTDDLSVIATPGTPTPSPVDNTCIGDLPPPTLIANPSDPLNFVRWYSDASVDDLTSFIASGNSIPFPVTVVDTTTAGTYSVWVLERNAEGCSGPAQEVQIIVVDCSCPFFESDFQDVNDFCEGTIWSEETKLDKPSEGTLTWYYPDGTSQETENPQHMFVLSDPCGEIQEATWEIVCNATGDTTSGIREFMVHPLLDDDSVTITETEAEDECTFITIDSNCPQFEIFLSDSNGSVNGLEYQVQEEDAGTLEIDVSQPDVISSFCNLHTIELPYSCLNAQQEILVPNAFSPNGDGVNELFSPIVENITSVEFAVLNRWGQEVFKSQDLSNRWDGTYDGNLAPSGLYVFYVIVEFVDGTVGKELGNLTLVR